MSTFYVVPHPTSWLYYSIFPSLYFCFLNESHIYFFLLLCVTLWIPFFFHLPIILKKTKMSMNLLQCIFITKWAFPFFFFPFLYGYEMSSTSLKVSCKFYVVLLHMVLYVDSSCYDFIWQSHPEKNYRKSYFKAVFVRVSFRPFTILRLAWLHNCLDLISYQIFSILFQDFKILIWSKTINLAFFPCHKIDSKKEYSKNFFKFHWNFQLRRIHYILIFGFSQTSFQSFCFCCWKHWHLISFRIYEKLIHNRVKSTHCQGFHAYK